jgi:hypothetical protein
MADTILFNVVLQAHIFPRAYYLGRVSPTTCFIGGVLTVTRPAQCSGVLMKVSDVLSSQRNAVLP